MIGHDPLQKDPDQLVVGNIGLGGAIGLLGYLGRKCQQDPVSGSGTLLRSSVTFRIMLATPSWPIPLQV